MISIFKPQTSDDENAKVNWQKQEEINTELSEISIIDGRLISDIEINSTVVLVPHKLGRAYKGWLIVRDDSGEAVFEDSSSDADKTKFIALLTGNATEYTFSIWIF